MTRIGVGDVPTAIRPLPYQPLVDHLVALAYGAVVLTLPAVEAIIGGPLPASACTEPFYWMGKTMMHVRQREALGWRARKASDGDEYPGGEPPSP